MCSIDVLEPADLDGLDARQLAVLMVEADGARRRLEARHPQARSAAHAGVLGVAQSHLLAKVFANPRCAEQLPGIN